MSSDWLELSTNSSIIKYSCFLNFEQEPYFIVKYTNHTTVYDEKYINYGFNKISYVETLRLTGYSFYLASRMFAFDLPHHPYE